MGEVGASVKNPRPKSTSLFLQIVEHPDGTISRPIVPISPPSSNQSNPQSRSLSKDLTLNPVHGTSLRLYCPNHSPLHKLPIIVFFHGGGFVAFNASTVFYHEECEQMAAELPAIVVSLDYRLAPEHRLPAAYDDGVEALSWVWDQAKGGGDPWITNHGDFSRCYLMGSSSGGNMAYHAGIRTMDLDGDPIVLAGVILNQPYLGGEERTSSETASEEDPVLPLRANDTMWRLALPKGADRDHEFCNVVKAAAGRRIRLPRCLVLGFDGDPLIDRQREFARVLREGGVSVVARFGGEGFHAAELFVPAKAMELIGEVREFISNGFDADANVA
ncbi:putative carboxylesterase [Dioscorea sansibarensis]